MNELERASTTLLDHPPARPAPLEQIERRAGAVRRRRRLYEAMALGVVVLLVGSAVLVLGSVRGDDGQGVFVGEGPGPAPDAIASTYHLVAPVDVETATALQTTLQNRLFLTGFGDAAVEVAGTTVTVTSLLPPDVVDALVTAPGGYELRPVQGEVDPAVCDSAIGGEGPFYTSGMAGPPKCLGVLAGVPMPDQPTMASGVIGESGSGYRVELVLTAEASQAVLDGWGTCALVDAHPCDLAPLAVVAREAIIEPEALVRLMPNGGPEVQVQLGAFADEVTAKLWAALLAHPLPDGVTVEP